MVVWVVIDRRHYRQASPFALLLSTPLFAFPHLSPSLSVVCKLFCTLQNLNSFLFNRFRTLCQKHPGWGYLLPLYEDQNETANCQSRRAIRSLQPPRPQGSSMPCPGSGPALWSLSAPSRRAATRPSRRSFPAPDDKVPVFSNRTGHQLFPLEPLPAPGTKPHLPPPRRRSLLHQQPPSAHASTNSRRRACRDHRPHQPCANKRPSPGRKRRLRR